MRTEHNRKMLNGTPLLAVKCPGKHQMSFRLWLRAGASRRAMQWFQLGGSPSSSDAGITWTQQSGCRREKARAT